LKCHHCSNELPKRRGWATENKPGKIACALPGCRSHGLKIGSKEYSVIVMGRDLDAVNASYQRRVAKGITTKRLSGLFDDKSNNPYSREYWRKKGLTESQIDFKFSVKAKKGIETKRKSGFFDNPANNAYSIDYGIKKLGLSEKKAKERIRSKNHNCSEFWEKKGYDESTAKFLSKKSAATNSLSENIRRYGEVEGLNHYLLTKKKLSLSWTQNSRVGQSFGSSVQANRFIRSIYKQLLRWGYNRSDILSANAGREFFLRDGKNIFFYDLKVRPLNAIIEFNGEHVHPNKELLTEERWLNWKHAFSKKTADEVHKQDEYKLYIAIKAGYNVLTVWSKDSDKLVKAINFLRRLHERTNHQAQSSINSSPTCKLSKSSGRAQKQNG
jgi:hypothetical protein